MKSLQSYLIESESPFGDQKATYSQVVDSTTREEGNGTNPPMEFNSMSANMRRWKLTAEDLTEFMSVDSAVIFRKVLNSPAFRNREDDFIFYVSSQWDNVQKIGIGCSRPTLRNNTRYAVFRVDIADRLAYWLKDNLKHCIKYMDQYCQSNYQK